MSLIPSEYGVEASHEVRRWAEIKTGYTHFADGDLALAKITPCFENGKSTLFRGLTGGFGTGTTELHVVRPVLVCAEYLLIFLKSPHFIGSGVPKMTGTAGQKRVPTEYFAHSSVPIPPLAEQYRIVSKLQELMTLCDRLENAQLAREKQRDQLEAATYHHLTNEADAQVAGPSVDVLVNCLPRLTATARQIENLRQAVRNLAICGRLVQQDSNDNPASSLLARIKLDRQRILANKTVRQGKKSPLTPTPGLRFLPPDGWEVVSLGDLCNLITSGSRGWAEYYSDSGAKFIRAQNIRFGRLVLDDLASVNLPKKSEGIRTQVSKYDLLIVITGAGVTNPAMLQRDLGEAYVSQHVGLIKPTDTAISRWLLLCLMAPRGGRSDLLERAYGAGKPGLNLDNIRSLTIPLPPLDEQSRIMSKVDELIAICDQLETLLEDSQTERQRLLEASLQSALQGSCEQIEELKAFHG